MTNFYNDGNKGELGQNDLGRSFLTKSLMRTSYNDQDDSQRTKREVCSTITSGKPEFKETA